MSHLFLVAPITVTLADLSQLTAFVAALNKHPVGAVFLIVLVGLAAVLIRRK